MPQTLYNTLTRQLEPLVPHDPARVTFYSCGPTVYDYAHIGNFRSFLAADLLRRWLESPLCTVTDEQGNEVAGPREVVHVMNITDVGHMTDDDNADGAGEDKMEAAAKRLLEDKKSGKLPEGVAATMDPNDPYAIADFYATAFLEDARRLGLKVSVEARDRRLPHAAPDSQGPRDDPARQGTGSTTGTPTQSESRSDRRFTSTCSHSPNTDASVVTHWRP